jgi:CheY-like chemotaxis protein
LSSALSKEDTQDILPLALPPTGTKILLIDDELDILDAMQTMLIGWNCQVLTAATHAQARKHLATQFEPAMLIVDYHLHDINGLSVIRELRREFKRDYRAIIVTGATEPKILAEIASAGFEVLAKPIDPHRLSDLLSN